MYLEMRRGFLTALPLLLGIFPLGVILGAQAAHVGQAPLTTLLMTGINLAGGSEFAALALWSAVPPILMIVVSTFLINSRHIVLGTALAPYVRNEGGFRIALIYFLMCDETWALAMQDIQRRNLEAKPFAFYFYLGVGLSLWVAWWFAAFLGAAIGSSIGDLDKFGFKMALPATFIALAIAMRPKQKIAYIPIALSFIASALTAKFGNPNYCVGAGVVAGLTAAYIIRVYQEKMGLIATQGDLKELNLSTDQQSSSPVPTSEAATVDATATPKATDETATAPSTCDLLASTQADAAEHCSKDGVSEDHGNSHEVQAQGDNNTTADECSCAGCGATDEAGAVARDCRGRSGLDNKEGK